MEEYKHPTLIKALRACCVVFLLFILYLVIQISFLNALPMTAGRKAVEATLRGNLHEIRDAIAKFKEDTGTYPVELFDLTRRAEDLKTKSAIKRYKGPYLTTQGGFENSGIPLNPLIRRYDPILAHHWRYDPQTGKVQSAVDGVSLEGEKYSEM